MVIVVGVDAGMEGIVFALNSGDLVVLASLGFILVETAIAKTGSLLLVLIVVLAHMSEWIV